MAANLEIWDHIVGTAMVKRNHERLFCLGPNVGRISFASQQMRALNLVWALKESGRIKTNDHIAIVGAGVSGVTAAFAARAMGCAVTLVERGDQILHRQRATTHRHVHPTINWWPKDELLPTTNLPFLNWHLGQCNLVMDLLEKEWKKLRKESGTFVEFLPNETASEVFAKPVDEGRLVLKISSGQIEKLDAVIVACGFGEERGLAEHPTRSYWRADELESLRSEPNAPTKFIVSGTGDGGLIDSLRIAYELDFGALIFRVAELIDGTDLAAKLALCEENPNQADFFGLAEDIHKGTGTVHQAVRDLLKEHLRSERTRYVILADKVKTDAFVGGPAAVHRLLVAYAMWHGVIEFLNAEVEVDDHVIRVGTEEFKKANTSLIVRHGAAPFHDPELIKASEWDDLESRQRHSSEYSFKKAWGESPYPTPSGWSCPVLDPQGFTSAIKNLANRTLRAMGSNGHLVTRADTFIVYEHDIAYRPKHLFGREVLYLNEEDVETVNALS